MLVEILVFNRDQRVAENFWMIVIGGDDAALKREGSDDSTLRVIEFGDGAGTILFKFFNLGQIRRIDQQQASCGAHGGGEQDEQSEQEASDQLPIANFYRRKMLENDFHGALTNSRSFASLRMTNIY